MSGAIQKKKHRLVLEVVFEIPHSERQAISIIARNLHGWGRGIFTWRLKSYRRVKAREKQINKQLEEEG